MREDSLICTSCGQVLTDDEQQYLHDLCNKCECDRHEELKRWKAGEANPKYDHSFQAEKNVLH